MGQDSKIFLITISNLETQKGSAHAIAFAFGFYELADFTNLLPLSKNYGSIKFTW